MRVGRVLGESCGTCWVICVRHEPGDCGFPVMLLRFVIADHLQTVAGRGAERPGQTSTGGVLRAGESCGNEDLDCKLLLLRIMIRR